LDGWAAQKALRKTITKYISTDIDFYIEVFGGAGWVMFYKERWARNEVYNDLDNRLVNLFRQIKWHPEALMFITLLAITYTKS
jgi:DNA adenine methylase